MVKADLEVFQKFIRFCKSRHPKVFPNSLQPELVKPETIKFVPTSSCPAKEDGGREVLVAGGGISVTRATKGRACTCVGSTTSSVLGNLTSRFDTLGQAASEL